MGEKFYRADGDFYAIVVNEDLTYDIGEFSATSANPYWTNGLRLPNIEIAKEVCRVMVETFSEGRDSCECYW